MVDHSRHLNANSMKIQSQLQAALVAGNDHGSLSRANTVEMNQSKEPVPSIMPADRCFKNAGMFVASLATTI